MSEQYAWLGSSESDAAEQASIDEYNRVYGPLKPGFPLDNLPSLSQSGGSTALPPAVEATSSGTRGSHRGLVVSVAGHIAPGKQDARATRLLTVVRGWFGRLSSARPAHPHGSGR